MKTYYCAPKENFTIITGNGETVKFSKNIEYPVLKVLRLKDSSHQYPSGLLYIIIDDKGNSTSVDSNSVNLSTPTNTYFLEDYWEGDE